MKKKDKVLTYAIGISIAAHLVAISVIGRTSASRMNSASVSEPSHLIDVSLVDPNKPLPVQRTSFHVTQPRPLMSEPVPARMNNVQQSPVPSNSIVPQRYASVQPMPRQVRSVATSSRMPGNPGGKLNTGSVSIHGDLGGNWRGGGTPVGWVPGAEDGNGRGSGRVAGEGRPEPVSNASEGQGTRPAPQPVQAPPPPRRVHVRICDVSGMLAGEYCSNTRTESFIEGTEPGSHCNRCKAPEHKSRLADQEKPVLARDSRVNVPGSVDEGMNLSVTVEYTVTAEGSVSGIEVVRSSGNRAVDRAVISAVSELRYKPAVQDGVPRSVKMNRTYKINT